MKILRTLLMAGVAMGCVSPAIADYPIVLRGWLEHAVIAEADLKMDAKLDTGAKTSSIDADILTDPDKDDQTAKQGKRVVFRLSNEDGEERTLERPIVRIVKIKKRGGGVEERPVVELTVCLGTQSITTEFSLADRSNFNYPILLGREFMKAGHIAVRADEEYVEEPNCTSPSPADG